MSVQPISLSERKAEQPLQGKTVLVTRPKKQSDEFVQLLKEFGADVVLAPMIEISPPQSWEACDRALANVHTYEGILLTSANAVEYFFKRDHEVRSGFFTTLSIPLYVVGEKTKQKARELHLTTEELTGVVNAKTLGRALTKSGIAGKRFLFPKGNIARDELPSALRKANALVDEIVVYETHQPLQTEVEALKKMLRENAIDVISFFSPSSVKNFLELIPRSTITRQCIAVIGNSTAEAAREASLSAHIVAPEPTAVALASAIVKFYE